MAIRVTLECGHASVLRVRTTPEGYTHDWEVFVRGVDNADIHHYIDKVVFHLHETFPKPKRVLKEPPFIVKESGYAGFLIPIDIYLKNKDEPKKFQVLYDLQLQPSGPAINNVIRHTEIFNNPNDDFRRKLLKGGAVIVAGVDGRTEKGDSKAPPLIGKPKLSGSEAKKHRLVEPKTSNAFADLFGPPIKTAKISPDNKKVMQVDKTTMPKPPVLQEKSDKSDKTIKNKDSPHKDGKKDKSEEKKDKKQKDISKEKSRSKDKIKRSSSPGSKSHSSPMSRRPSSPVVTKKPTSPVPLPQMKRSASPKTKEKDLKKSLQEKEKENDRIKDNSKTLLDISKSEKKKEKKKHKEDKDKERKEKYKDSERAGAKEVLKSTEKKTDKPEKLEKSEKDRSQELKVNKDGRKSPKQTKEVERAKEEKSVKSDKSEKADKTEKIKEGRTDKDRQKHKHKKRDKKDKRDSSKEREKREKKEKSKGTVEKQNNVPPASTTPLSALLAEMPERDSSDSAPSMDDDCSFPEGKTVVKKEADVLPVSTLSTETTKLSSPVPPADIRKERGDRGKKDKLKGNKGGGEERESKKRKRKSESKADDEHLIVKREKDRGHSTSPLVEPVSSSQSPVAVEAESALQNHPIKDEDERSISDQTEKVENDAEQVAPDSTNLVEPDLGKPPVFSEDYVSQLKDLQQKIMTLQDNQELQRVVRIILETGQYEITKKTFDFDLCALDRRTVQRLQQFFPAS
ncbi:protein AF-9-like [Prorops nasuta]|uniref:protein AF-9-like n=1 Tax=Prorops nasuta TaxID=863751 RepID=UPI0034CF3B7D